MGSRIGLIFYEILYGFLYPLLHPVQLVNVLVWRKYRAFDTIIKGFVYI